MSSHGPRGASPTRETRVAPEFDPDDEQARLLSKTLLTPESDPLNLFRTLVRYPEMMRRVNALGGMFMAHGALPPRVREIVILRVAWKTNCDYEYAQHAPIGRRVGLSDTEILMLGEDAVESWSDPDRAVIEFTDELLSRGTASDDVWARLAQLFQEDQLIELSLLVGYYQMLAIFLNTLGVPLESGSVGLPRP